MQVRPPIHPSSPPSSPVGQAWFAGVRARGAIECVDVLAEPERLREPGLWVLVGEFEGRVRAWRFAEVERGGGTAAAAATRGDAGGAWCGPDAAAWRSSLDRRAYEDAVRAVQDEIRAGEVYQANLCRVLAAPLGDPGGPEPDAQALARRLERGNPAPFGGGIHVPGGGAVDPVWVVSASPELFLRLEGDVLTSSPIKGTATTPDGLTGKDEAENVMIADLVRNDLQRVCLPGTVEVTALLATERHPGLVHLVSTVQGRLLPHVRDSPQLWREVLAATFPPGSVSGAPKSSALEVIARLEPVPRGPYCGALGWVDVAGDGSVRAELAVGIRGFWWDRRSEGRDAAGTLRFGTGAGITWGSEASAEWDETELKAARLVALASSGAAPVRDWAP